MALVTREQVFSAQDIKSEDVPVPEWGGPDAMLRVRGLSGLEWDEFEMSLLKERRTGGKVTKEAHMAGARAKLVVMAAIDEHGNRLFVAGDLDPLMRRSVAPLDRAFQVVMRLSGKSQEVIEELGEDSASNPNAGSSSGLLLV